MGRNFGAAMTLDIEKSASPSKEARQAVAAALDALEEWRVEIGAANERCLQKVCDQVTNAHRTLGWTEQASSAAKENLLKASNLQLQMIEQAMELWQQELKAQNWRSDLPGSRLQAPTPMQFTRLLPLTLTPFQLWIEVAEAWQRAWISTMSGGALSDPSWKSSTRNTESSTRRGTPSS
jgi:hypothetical protein